MEYQLYYGNGEILLEEGQRSRSSWEVSPPGGRNMDSGDNCFEWNELKIDEGDGSVGEETGVGQRKRKLEREGL